MPSSAPISRWREERRTKTAAARTAASTAGEMTKWFDTNYHYIVPEIEPGLELRLGRLKIARGIS